jgi:hypothetical protein
MRGGVEYDKQTYTRNVQPKSLPDMRIRLRGFNFQSCQRIMRLIATKKQVQLEDLGHESKHWKQQHNSGLRDLHSHIDMAHWLYVKKPSSFRSLANR